MFQSRSGDEPSALSNHRSYDHGFGNPSVAEPFRLPSAHPFASEITELTAFAPIRDQGQAELDSESPRWETAEAGDAMSAPFAYEGMGAAEAWKMALRTSWKDAKMHLRIRLARLIDAIVWPNNAHAVSLPPRRRAREAA